MELQTSERVQSIKPSPTISVTTRAAELRAAGHDVIGLGAGEPDFDTPEHIRDAAKKAIDDGLTRYTAPDGVPSLKLAIIDKFARDNDLNYSPKQIVVSVGAKHSLFNLIQALLNPGDEVIIPAPYWVSYPDMVLLADGKPVIIETDMQSEFKITPEQLEGAVTTRTRLLLLNSPSNPTGVTYSRAEFEGLGEVLRRYPNVVIGSDDIYEHILWSDEPFSNIVTVCPDLYDRTIVINGVSKTYAMTGWRIGYAAGSEKLARAMAKIQSQSTSNPSSISQAAAQAALKGDQDCVARMVAVFHERHDYVLERLNRLNGVSCLPAQGAFYAFPDMQRAIESLDGVSNDIEFAEHLISEAGVALVPGSAFGAPGYARLSYATSMDNLRKALDRLENALGTKN